MPPRSLTRKKRRGSPRLPWKRGPAAWTVACRAEEILQALGESRKRFFSLRRAARLLGLSTQPLRDWIKRGHLQPDGPRRQFSAQELDRFVRWLADRAEPFDSESCVERFRDAEGRLPYPFKKLASARFTWPTGSRALTPRELAGLLGCYPSLVVKAIRSGILRGRRPTPCRWEVPREAWDRAFPGSRITTPRLPDLPKGDAFTVATVVQHLRACGLNDATDWQARIWIREGRLEAFHRQPGGRKWFVRREALRKFCPFLKLGA